MTAPIVDVPVLIVGGGGAGLTASTLLSQLGVDSLLLSARPGTSVVPKAHVLNQRTMEILRGVGLADTVYERGAPPGNMSHTAWYTGLCGEHDDYGRELGRIEVWGAGGADPAWTAASACRTTNLPQIRLEPLLRQRAEELGPGRVRFGQEVTAIEQDDDGVTATVTDGEWDTSYRVRSRYLLACDGGRTLGPQLGIAMDGVKDLFRSVSVHITADLSRWVRDPEVLIHWLWMPHIGTGCALIPMGPTRWGPHSEEWVFHLSYPNDVPALEDAAVVAEMRTALGLADHDITVNRINHWSVEGVVADRFRDGRVLLLGDAAHRLPPTGGLGLNSAIQDAHNLAWKLAAVLDGHAGPALLDTYEDERKPVAVRNVQQAVSSIVNHLQGLEVAGLGPGSDPATNWATLRRVWGDEECDAGFRADLRRAFAAQSMEFDALNVEYGYTYDSAAVVADGTPEPANPDPVRVYQPATRPGHPLPHAWLDDEAGTRTPIMDLVGAGRFLLITGEEGGDWAEAAAKVAVDLGAPLDTVRIGHVEGDYLAPRSAWTTHRGIGPHGAVLVRPDRFVAWRSAGADEDPAARITEALEQILGRPADGGPVAGEPVAEESAARESGG